MKSVWVIAAACALSGMTPVFGQQTTYTFDDLPSQYVNTSTQTGQDILNFYSGITFGAGIQGNSVGNTLFPPHSGTVDIINTLSSGDATINFTITTPTPEVSFWYSTGGNGTSLSITVVDADGTHIVLAPGTSFDPTTGTGSDLFVDLTGNGITSVSIDDGLGSLGAGGFQITDDITIGSAVPDTASSFALLGIASIGLFAFQRKVKAVA